MNKLRKILLSLLFPEYYNLLYRIHKLYDWNNESITTINQRFELIENILKSEVWEQIKQKYEGEQT